MDDDFVIDGSVEVSADDDGFDNSDLGVTPQDDDDGFNIDLDDRDDVTEENLHAQFTAFHAWHEKEYGEAYTAEDIPEAVIERFNTFDVEKGRHLSLVEANERVNRDKQQEEMWKEHLSEWATTDF